MANNFKVLAQVSNIQSSDIYMTVSMIMFEEEKANLNGVRCTAAFIDEIVMNRDRYIGLPLVADTEMLHTGKLDTLSHNYDPATDTFGTEIIGAFVDFQKGASEDGTPALIGVARISKRDAATCEAIASLFAQNKLKFSFEIACSHMTQLEDNTIVIDAGEGNTLTALAVVSTPACPNAVAMNLVAENNCTERKEAEAMNAENPEIIITEDVVDESTTSDEVTVEVAEVNEPADVPAEVEVSAEITETDVVNANEADSENNEENDPTEDETEEADEEEDAACKKHNSEVSEINLEALMSEIASLKEAVAALAELCRPTTAEATAEPTTSAEVTTEPAIEVAEVKPVVAEAINPFMDDINAEPKWTLLDEEPKITSWTLI